MKDINSFSFKFFSLLLLTCSLINYESAGAQAAQGVSCVVSAGNRNSPLATDGSYFISGIPGNLGAIRARATCSDGTFGQSDIGFTDPNQTITIPLGPIEFGRLDPVPIAANLTAQESRLRTGDTSQLSFSAIGIDGTITDITSRSDGTVYSISNDLLATISENGLVTVTAQFDTSSSARVVTSATTEGSVSSTYMYHLGPLGKLTGTVFKPDNTTPVVGAQVSILRLQPRESVGFSVTDANGRFSLDSVNAGSFIITVLEPDTGARALANASIVTEGEVVDVHLVLNGLGTVNVTVVNDNGDSVSGTDVTLTALGAYIDSRVLTTNNQGIVSFTNVTAGDFSVSTRDQATGLLGAIVDELSSGDVLDLTLRLQETGSIHGVVFDTDGTTLVSDVQVRISSRQRGVISQSVTMNNGVFSFDTLPKMDEPFILDAFIDGRLRARVPGIIYAQGDENLERNITLSAVGTVSGIVSNESNSIFSNARVKMQSLEGLRLTFDAFTNQSGVFVLPAVPVGDFELTATTEDGQTAHAVGRVDADGDNVVVNLIIAGNTIIGTVYQRDGLTPVDAGVKVYLAHTSDGQVYSYANDPDVLYTETDENGRYGFSITQAGDYYVQAEDNLDRGRSRAILVNLDPSQPLETDVTFLAKGSISGVVTSANGNVQANIAVTVFTEGAFDAQRTILTDSNGVYSLDGVFAGDIVVKAINETTQQSGLRISRLDEENQHVIVNVVLSASGKVRGQIFKADGTVENAKLDLTLYSNEHIFSTFEVIGGSYEVLNVPLGDVKVVSEVQTTHDKGQASTSVSYLNEVKNLDIHLVGQGQLEVELVDASNNPVVGARVSATTNTPFSSSIELLSDETGKVIFERIYAGDFAISAVKDQTFGSLQGSYSSTMIADTQNQTTITMTAVAVGKVLGTVYKPDGITPQGAGWVVRMLPEPYTDAYITTTDTNGNYSFDPVNAGTYTIDAHEYFDRNQCPIIGRILARAANVSLTTQGQEVTADLQFIGAGVVFGVVTDANNIPQNNITVTLTNPDAIYGANSTCSGQTTYQTTTNNQGEYRFEDIPSGNFTLIAEDASKTQRAEGNGRVRFNEDEAEVNLSLIDNVITLPHSFYDANGFLTDMSGDGSLSAGTQSVFAAAAPDNGAMRLEIVSNNIAVPFVNGNGTLGRLLADGQEIAIDDTTASGLFVTRRIFTPRTGYFTRYLEVLENPTQAPITVDVKIKSHHRESNSNPRVVDTSDGDQVLSVINQSAPDRWLVIDDQNDIDPFENNSIPAIGYVFDGENASTQATLAQFELIGQTGRLTYQWNNITLQPGQKIMLMHFVFGQIQRTGAHQAALRLENLPPEAIDDLTASEKNQIINFNVPENSTQNALPNLSLGQISGKVLSGDGVTSVPDAQVIFKSQHPLFGRIRYTQSDENGNYEFHSTLDGTVNNYVIPIYGYTIYAKYQRSQAQSAITPSSFNAGTTSNTQDLIFVGTGDIRGTIYRHNGAIAGIARIVMCEVNNRSTCFSHPDNYTSSKLDGSYVMYANNPHDYYIFVDKEHPQSYFRNIWGNTSTTSSAADVTVANISLEQTGSISGYVKAANNSIVSEAEVVLYENSQSKRKTFSDTAGFYRFYDVPVGQFSMQAKDVISHAQGVSNAAVVVDTETNQDIILQDDTLLNVTVKYQRNELTADARVQLKRSNTNFILTGNTDSNGIVQFQVPEGTYDLTAYHPNNANLFTSTTLIIPNNSTQEDTEIILPAAGKIFGTIVRPDHTTLAGGFPYHVQQLRGDSSIGGYSPNTNDTGAYQVLGLPLGDYIITAFDAQQDRFADAEFSITQDGQEIQIDMTLMDDRIALPANILDANRFVFDVQENGSLATGSYAFSQGGGSQLLINNELFSGDTSARLQAGKRQFAISQDTLLSGLNVSRKIYVPYGAYFARYIEVLENNSAQDITVDVALHHGFAQGEYVATSGGDSIFDLQDKWLMLDDDADTDVMQYPFQLPATALIYADNSTAKKPSAIDISYSNLMANVVQEWHQVVVPAGQRVSIMHFVVQQINRAGAEFAANRLMRLPPEALQDLSLADKATILNFSLPVDGVSAVESLPPLTSSISGNVREAGESVPVSATRVTVQSSHPLFARKWGMQKDNVPGCQGGTVVASLLSDAPNANYSLQGQLTALDSIALPAGFNINLTAQRSEPCYSQFSGHPFTNFPSRVLDSEVPSQQTVVFDTTILTGTVIGSNDFSITSGRVYRTIDNPNRPDYQYVTIANDGSYIYPGVKMGVADLIFDTNHPDGFADDTLRGIKKSITTSTPEVLVSDITIQATGTIQGTILASDSSFVENGEVTLTSTAENQTFDMCDSGCVAETLAMHLGKREVSRRVYSDSLGHYSFSAIPVGDYVLTARDPISAAITTVQLTVNSNQVTVQNVTLTVVGSATVTVLDSTNNPVADAYIYLLPQFSGSEIVAGRTNYLGELVVANIPLGDYTLRITDPRSPNFRYMDRTISSNISSTGQANDHEVHLLAAATFNVTVIDSNNGGIPVASANIQVVDASGSQRNIGTTDVNGMLSIAVIPEGNYVISASKEDNGNLRETSVQGEVLASDDNSVTNVTLDLKDTQITLPVILKDANNQSYTISVTNNYSPKLFIDDNEFVASSNALTQLNSRQITVETQNSMSNLTVKRKVFTPKNGYFTRYIEQLSNETNTDIAVNVKISTTIYSRHVANTSNGDIIIDNGNNPDLWFATDRNVSFISSGENATVSAPNLSFTQIDSVYSNAQAQWLNLIIPANSRVQLLHFYSKQNGLPSATASAQRLVQLPPEALIGLVNSDINEIINFNIPADLTSTLPALPNLLGVVNGKIYQGDGVTPVSNAYVKIQSTNLLFNNEYQFNIEEQYHSTHLKTDSQGNYSLSGTLNNDFSVAIPLDSSIIVKATHPVSSLVVENTTAFNANENTVTQDVVFATGTIEGTVSGQYHGSSEYAHSIFAFLDGVEITSVTSTDGTYSINGLQAGSYRIESKFYNTQNLETPLVGFVENTVVTVGNTTPQNIVYPQNGSIAGQVFSINGIEQPNQTLELTQENSSFTRTVTSNATGNYEFGAVPVGNYIITATDADTQAHVTSTVSVSQDNTTQKDLTLLATGHVTITVKTTAGIISEYATVYLESSSVNGRVSLGQTDTSGQLTAEIAVGDYTLFVSHPSTGEETSVQGTVNAANENSAIEIVLPVAAKIQITVMDADNNQAIENAVVTIRELNSNQFRGSGRTNADGIYLSAYLKQVPYLVKIVKDNNYETSTIVEIPTSLDGQALIKNITFRESQHITNNFNFAQAHYLYQVSVTNGDTLSTSIRGFNAATSQPCAVDVALFDTTGALVAQGNSTFNGQANSLAHIDYRQVTQNGRYTLMLNPTNSSCFENYRLAVSLNGQSVGIENYQDGGQVTGVLYEADATTPRVNDAVQLTTTNASGLIYSQQTQTDANGHYQFNNVPLGNYDLTYVARPTVTETGVISTAGENVNQDLILSSTTVLNIHVLNADNTPLNRQVRLDIQPIGGTLFRPYTDSQGEYTYTYYGFEILSVSATSPTDNQIIATQYIQPVDGQTLEVNLVLSSINISGHVYLNDGVTPVSDANVLTFYEQNNKFIKNTFADSQGNYSLPLPLNNTIKLVAQHPVNQTYTQRTIATGTSDQSFDIILDAVGTVYGKLTGAANTPIPHAEIIASYQDNYISGSNLVSIQTTTDANGNYSFTSIPLNQVVEIKYSSYRPTGEISVSDTTTLVNSGDSSEINLFISGAAISVQLSAADNQPLGGECNFFLNRNNSGGGLKVNQNSQKADTKGGGLYDIEVWNVNCDDRIVMAGIDLTNGTQYQLIVENWNGVNMDFTEDVTLIADNLVTVNHVYSVVKGTVTYFDNTPVANAQMTLNSQPFEADAQGHYSKLNIATGNISIKAEDTSSSLQTTIETQLLDNTNPLIVDIQLPASATITGQVLDTLGAPIENITVYADSTNATTVLQNNTDVNGNYGINNIVLGNVEISAINQTSNNVVSSNVQLTTDGETQTQNLQFMQPGSLSGLLNDETAQALASGCIKVGYTQKGAAYQGLNIVTNTDASGLYTINSLASGTIRVTGMDDCNAPTKATLDETTINSNTNSTLNLQLGNAKILPFELNQSGNNYSFIINASGDVQSKNKSLPYGFNQSFSQPISLTINNKKLNTQTAALIEDSNTELSIGPTDYNDISYKQKVYTPNSGQYIRLLDSITNNAISAQQVTIKLQGIYGYKQLDEFNTTETVAILSIDPATTSNHYAIQKVDATTGFPSANYIPATTAYVFSDSNDLLTVNPSFQDANNKISWSWTITLQPGETKSLLSYVLVQTPTSDASDITALTTLANDLVNGTQVNMYNGLDASEKASILNFQVPQ